MKYESVDTSKQEQLLKTFNRLRRTENLITRDKYAI